MAELLSCRSEASINCLFFICFASARSGVGHHFDTWRTCCLCFMPHEMGGIIQSAFSQSDTDSVSVAFNAVSASLLFLCKTLAYSTVQIHLAQHPKVNLLFLKVPLKRVRKSCSRTQEQFYLVDLWAALCILDTLHAGTALHQFILFTFGSYLSSCKH